MPTMYWWIILNMILGEHSLLKEHTLLGINDIIISPIQRKLSFEKLKI